MIDYINSEIIQEIKELAFFSDFLPNNQKLLFSEKIETILNKIELSNKTNVDFNEFEKLREEFDVSFYGKSIFELVTDSIIPVIKQDEFCRDLSILEKETLLKIDNNLSLYEIYVNNDTLYPNFILFISIIIDLEEINVLTFSRKQENFTPRGWIKIGELLSSGNILLPFNIEEAQKFKDKNRKMFIGEAFVQLNMITDKLLRNSLKVQKWLSKTIEKLSV
ncbi:MAG: hypothetical protein AABZ74_02975 [Cyanobacteriota bacterium]